MVVWFSIGEPFIITSFFITVLFSVLLFVSRDAREPLKCLTPEERKEINQRENSRLGLFSAKNYPLSGRERALKIYLDNSPSKSDDAD